MTGRDYNEPFAYMTSGFLQLEGTPYLGAVNPHHISGYRIEELGPPSKQTGESQMVMVLYLTGGEMRFGFRLNREDEAAWGPINKFGEAIEEAIRFASMTEKMKQEYLDTNV